MCSTKTLFIKTNFHRTQYADFCPGAVKTSTDFYKGKEKVEDKDLVGNAFSVRWGPT